MKKYEVYMRADVAMDALCGVFNNRYDAEAFITGKLVEHVVQCCRAYWNVERFSDEYCINIGSNFNIYRIDAVEI